MNPSRLLAFSLVAFLLIVVPGPSVLFIIGRAISVGRGAALLTVVGNAAGELIQLLALAVGVGAVVAASMLAFTVIKLLGAVYLLYLGVATIRARHRREPVPSRALAADHRRVLRQGMLVGLTNPKSMVFFAAVLPQFVDRSLGRVPLQLLALGLVWLGIALISDSAWALLAGRVRDWFARSPARAARVRAGGGVIMVGLGLGLALTSRTGAA